MTVLANERIVELTWMEQDVPLRMEALAATSEGATRWAESVLRANP